MLHFVNYSIFCRLYLGIDRMKKTCNNKITERGKYNKYRSGRGMSGIWLYDALEKFRGIFLVIETIYA